MLSLEILYSPINFYEKKFESFFIKIVVVVIEKCGTHFSLIATSFVRELTSLHLLITPRTIE